MTWEAIFFLAVLKIPVVYVSAVVWWAIRARPAPGRGLQPAAVERCPWQPGSGSRLPAHGRGTQRLRGGRPAPRPAAGRARVPA